MTVQYLFGKDFTFTFYPTMGDGLPISGAALVNAFVFDDSNKPDRAAAILGTNATQTVGSWTTNGNGYDLPITALSDPDVNSITYRRSFWLGINFKLQSGGDTQTHIVEMLMSRAVGTGAELSVTTADMQTYFPNIDSFVSDSDQASHIANAKSDLLNRLRSKNVDYWQLVYPEDLKPAVIWRALYLMSLGLTTSGEDGFADLQAEAKEQYASELQRLEIVVDLDLDGEPDGKVSGGVSFLEVVL